MRCKALAVSGFTFGSSQRLSCRPKAAGPVGFESGHLGFLLDQIECVLFAVDSGTLHWPDSGNCRCLGRY